MTLAALIRACSRSSTLPRVAPRPPGRWCPWRPPRRRLIVLDEPFKFVSDRGDYRARARDLLDALSTELGFQFVIVTHDPTFEIGKVIDLG